LKFFLGGDIRKDKDDLALYAEVVSFNPDVVVNPVEITSLLDAISSLFLARRVSLFFFSIAVVVAWGGKSLVHVEEHCVIGSHLNHLHQKAVFVDHCDPLVDSRQVVNELFKGCENGAVLDVKADNVLYIGTFIRGGLTPQELIGFLVQIADLLRVGDYYSVGQLVQHRG
jgi:hypothetical protein